MVIVEYCCFGNLQNFLLKHSKCFIDQINANGCIDPTVLKRKKERHLSNTVGLEQNKYVPKLLRYNTYILNANEAHPYHLDHIDHIAIASPIEKKKNREKEFCLSVFFI